MMIYLIGCIRRREADSLADEVKIKSYEVVCTPTPPGDEPVSVRPDLSQALAPDLLTDPIRTYPLDGDDVNGFISPSDQLGFTLHPPRVTISDHSGALPIRDEAALLIAKLLGVFEDYGLTIPTCTWEVEGLIRGERAAAMLLSLLDVEQASTAFNLRQDESWEGLHLGFSSATDWCEVTITDLWLSLSGDDPAVQFTIKGGFEELAGVEALMERGFALASLAESSTEAISSYLRSSGED